MNLTYKGFKVAYSGEGVYALFTNNECEVNCVWRKLDSLVEVEQSMKVNRIVCYISHDLLDKSEVG